MRQFVAILAHFLQCFLACNFQIPRLSYLLKISILFIALWFEFILLSGIPFSDYFREGLYYAVASKNNARQKCHDVIGSRWNTQQYIAWIKHLAQESRAALTQLWFRLIAEAFTKARRRSRPIFGSRESLILYAVNSLAWPHRNFHEKLPLWANDGPAATAQQSAYKANAAAGLPRPGIFTAKQS